MPTTFWNAPPHSSVSPTRRMTAFSCTLATGSLLTFLSVSVTVGSSLFMPFSTPASNQPGSHVDRLDQLGDGLARAAAAGGRATSGEPQASGDRVWESCAILY